MIATVDRGQINSNASQIAKDLDRAFLRQQQLKTFLDATPDGTLTATYGYVQADIDVLRSWLADTEALRLVYVGTNSAPSVKDYRVFAKLVWGLGGLF